VDEHESFSRKANLRPLDPFHLDPSSLSFRLRQIEFQLHPEPHFWAAAEGLGKPDGHFRRNPGATIHQIIEGLSRNAERPRSLRYGETQRLDALLPHNASRMGRVFHAHAEFS